MMNKIVRGLVTTAALASAGTAVAQEGKIVVANDEWTLSNTGFAQAPDTPKYVENVCNWFMGGAPGNFLAYTDNFGLNESTLAATITGLGHTWTVSSTITFDDATVSQYDALFVCGLPADSNVLFRYVKAGGHVYVASGARPSGGDAGLWNLFLSRFGLNVENPTNNLIGNIPIQLNHPLFHGVSALYQNNGTDVVDLRPADCLQRVIWSDQGFDLYAVSNAGGGMELHAYSATLLAGDTLELTAGMGLADKRAVLVVEDVDGIDVFIQIFLGKFDADCRWGRSITLPPGLPTADVTMVLYGIGLSGKIEPSNPVLIPFP